MTTGGTSGDDETVLIAGPDFARRRLRARLRRFRPLLYAAAVTALVGTGVWLLWFSSALEIREVEVTGNGTLSAARVEKVARAPLGEPLISVDLDAMEQRVEAIASVRSASVSRAWPHTVRIDVVERVPVAVVSRGVGLQAVDEDGYLFGSYASEPNDLPVIRTAPDVRREALAEAAAVIGSLRADIAAKVRHVDVQTVDRIVLRLKDGRRVTWGSADDSAQKAEVLAELLRATATTKPDEIDVSVPGRPTTR